MTETVTPDQSVREEDRPVTVPWWRRRWVRRLAGALVLLLIIGFGMVWLSSSAERSATLGPDSTEPDGAAALAALLREQGQQIVVVEDAEALAPDLRGSTVLLTKRPNALLQERLVAATPERIVMLSPPVDGPLSLPFRLSAPTDPHVLYPDCSDPLAANAGSMRTGEAEGQTFRANGAAPPGTVLCYPDGDSYAMVRVPVGDIDVVMLAGGLDNASLAEEGNAALWMTALGGTDDLHWVMTNGRDLAIADGPGGSSRDEDGPTLLPGWWPHALALGLVSLIAFAASRPGRFGPILVEPLPAVVPASETVEGHGRLYHRIRARDRAAQLLRGAARQRLGKRLGVEDPDALVAGLMSRTGRDRSWIQQTLLGGPPTTDDELVQLRHDLATLEKEAERQ
ncbi:DUF4350 domain-containing protein [Parenemella sanctibonifatiensis]|uniref:DUF4350 domain-containing protein n=1 Tax=Parenemella sanctibonifatiensis TaxID=2016505 RepID=A0A255EMN8_9ACTN|nr:DUF4350 domain-containing protein [Parenemella sanctibonifatiensis]OYN90875.1 hypothetical protein CGZ91_05140 [Parenemella sanctibonifatiensis]